MAEGKFPKADGEKLYGEDVNQINRGKSHFSRFMLPMINPYMGGVATNLLFDAFSSDSASATTNITHRHSPANSDNGYDTGMYYSDTAGAYSYTSQLHNTANTVTEGIAMIEAQVYKIGDETNDSSIAAGFFPTSTNCSEGTEYISGGQNSSLITKDLSGEVGGFFQFYGSCGANAGSTIALKFSDGTENLSILSIGVERSFRGEAMWISDWSNNLMHIYFNIFYDDTPSGDSNGQYPITYCKTLDVTAWSSWKIYATGSNHANISWKISGIRFLKNAATTDINLALTADNSNYETVVNGCPHLFTNTGTTMKLRVSGTTAANEVVVIRRVAFGPTL